MTIANATIATATDVTTTAAATTATAASVTSVVGLILTGLTLVIPAIISFRYAFKAFKEISGPGRHGGPGKPILAFFVGAIVLVLAIVSFVSAGKGYKQVIADREKAKAAADAMLEASGQALTQIGDLVEDLIAKQQAEKEAAAAKETEKLANANWPEVDISEKTYEKYRKYLDVAGRGTRSENAHNKAYIAELNGYVCNDAVYTPMYMDFQYFNELNGVFPVEKYPSLNDIDLQDAAARDAHLKKEHATQKEAWLALSDDERTDDVNENFKYLVCNDPAFGIGMFDVYCLDETWRKAYAEYYDRIEQLIQQAYESGEGINYFLEYKDEEHALAHEEQYAGVTEEYFTEIAVPVLETFFTGFTPNKRLEKRRTSMNMCLPYVLKDNLVRLQPANYQEERDFVTFSHFGKDGNEHKTIGFNTDDWRPADFRRNGKVTITEIGAAEEKQEKITKETVTIKAAAESPSTPDNPDTPPPGDNPTPPPPPPPPTTNPECTPDQEPTQDGTGGDQNGGDNKGDENGGDQNHDEARGEEQQDSEENKESEGSTEGTGENTGSESAGGSEGSGGGNETVHDPGANPTPPENKGSQNGNGGSTGGTVNTGTV